MKIETNKQWTTYRILDATIDNPDLADPFTVGAAGAGKDFIVHATASSGKLHWDEDANILYIIATTMMGYGSQFQFTPGDVGAGTGISFYNTDQYIRSLAANVLEIHAGAYIHMASKVVLTDKIQLQVSTAVTTATGELYLDSADALLTYGASPTTEYKVPCFAPGGDVVLPAGVGLVLLDGKLRLQVSTDVATTLGEIYIDSADGLITYHGGAEYKVPNFAPGGNVVLPSGVGLIMGDKLQLQLTTDPATITGQLYMDSADGRLTYSGSGATEYKVAMFNPAAGDIVVPTTIGIVMQGGYIQLFNTHDNGAREGDIWYNDLSHKLQFLNNLGAAETVNST